MFTAKAAKCLLVRSLVWNQQEHSQVFPTEFCYLSRLAIKQNFAQVNVGSRQRRETFCDRSSTFDLHTLCQMRPLAEMFDF